jgi:hypothetical protein
MFIHRSGCPSAKTGSCDTSNSIENIFMKLEIWVDGRMEIMHVFLSPYVEKSGCYDNNKT